MPFPVTSVFQLVNSIDRYKEFLPGCTESSVLSRDVDTYEASIVIQLYGMREQIVTLNQPKSNQSISMNLISGPFRELKGSWLFKDLGEGCRVTLEVECEFESRFQTVITGSVLERGITKTIDAFVGEVRRRHSSGESTHG